MTAGLIGFLVLAGHVWSLDLGLFLDDHAHYANLRGGDWSFQSAVKAAHLPIVGEVMDLWNRPPSGLYFFRPIAFWIMRAEYTVVRWEPVGMHVFSLLWHFTAAMLVGTLALRCFGHRGWAAVAAALMAIHPGHTATVYWIACQTELMTTVFLVAGVLAYARASGWGIANGEARPWFLTSLPYGHASPLPGECEPPRRTLLLIVSIVCYALALGCRENAVLFPVVCWLGDRLCGSSRRRWFRWEHFAMAGVLAGYAAIRIDVLGGVSLPPKPYLVPVHDPAFIPFLIRKIIYYLLGLFSFIPVIPKGEDLAIGLMPRFFYLGSAGIVVMLLVIWAVYGFRRAVLWPVIWLFCFEATVLPVFSSTHHLYLPSVGPVLLMTAGLAALGGVLRRTPGRVPKPQALLCGIILAAHGLGLGLYTWAMGFTVRAGTRIEDILVDEVIHNGSPLRDGDHLFFINFPLLAYYAVPAIESQTGRSNLQGHVLTFAPDMLAQVESGRAEVIGSHQLKLVAPTDTPFFGGMVGRAAMEVISPSRPPEVGQALPAGPFTITPTRMAPDGAGIEEMILTFEKPLASPDYHFFVGSPQFLAYPLEVLQKRLAPSSRSAISQPASSPEFP